MLDEEQHILRYWEKEFKSLKPKKNSAGNRKYSQKDVEVLQRIKELLRDNKLSLSAAREIVDNGKSLKTIDKVQTEIIEKRSNGKSSNLKTDLKISDETIQELVDVLKDISKLLRS